MRIVRLGDPLVLGASVALVLGVGSLGMLAWATLGGSTPSPSGAEPDRTIEFSMTDSLRFEPDRLTAKAGETVRFVIANPTSIDHEFVIGDAAAQQMHAGGMAGGMMRDDGHAVAVPARQTRELVFTFEAPGELQIGCHVSGHYEAGMRASVTVAP